MKTLIYYEKRKILRRKSTIIACLLMLLSIIALSFVFVSDQDYYRTDGTEVSGMEAIHVKQEMDHALAGPLTAKRLKDTLQQYHTVYGNSDNFGASGALKDEVYCKDILPYNGILNLMRRIYSPAGAYDMNILSSVTNERVENFYQDRHAQVQSIVDMDYTTGNYTQAEKDTILKLDTKVSDPITYDYSDGWKTLLTRDFPTIFLLIALVVCIIISPVFAYEYQTGADAVVLSSKYGRRETVWAKLIAGFTVTSRIYFIAVLVSLISVLAVFGVQGWNCDFQILSTTAYYGMKIWQVDLWASSSIMLWCCLSWRLRCCCPLPAKHRLRLSSSAHSARSCPCSCRQAASTEFSTSSFACSRQRQWIRMWCSQRMFCSASASLS